MTQRVLVSQYVFPEAVDQLREAGFEVDERTDDVPLSPEQLRERARGAAGLVCMLTDQIDAALFAAAPELAIVANVAVGYDNVDVEAATRAGAAVSNTPDVLTDATADLAWTLILSTARRSPEGDVFMRSGSYTHWKLAQEQLGMDVYGQNLNLFGFGKIGQAVARRAVGGFDMTVRYHDAYRLSPERERELGVTYVGMDELLETADFLSIHAPLTPETRHTLNAGALARMKPSAILINTARGPIVDEAALADALASGTIAGAGLDVYEDEPALHPGLVEQRERVVLLPHLGSATASTRRRMAEIAVGNVIDALTGQRPRTPVNPEVLTSTKPTENPTGA